MTRLLHYSYAELASGSNKLDGLKLDGLKLGGLVEAGGSVVIGNFDGLHRGHIALLRSLQQPACFASPHRPHSSFPRPWTLLTFEPHPRSFFSARKGASSPLRLSTAEQKHRWLENSEPKLEIDNMVVMRFDEQLSQMPASDFVQRFLLARLGAKHLIVGEDFAFGRKREGTLATLQKMSAEMSAGGMSAEMSAGGMSAGGMSAEMSAGGMSAGMSAGGSHDAKDKDNSFRVHCFPTLRLPTLSKTADNSSDSSADNSSDSSVAYSSTRARELLRQAKLDEVREILGRDFEIEGVVSKGKGLGSELGFPTANIDPRDYCHPLFGVYCVRVIHKGASYEAVASFGKRPTLGEGLQPLLEVHFFDCPSNLYGSELRVSFVKFQREEENYPSLDALRLQIAEDVRLAKKYFAEAANNGDGLGVKNADTAMQI